MGCFKPCLPQFSFAKGSCHNLQVFESYEYRGGGVTVVMVSKDVLRSDGVKLDKGKSRHKRG